MIINRTHRGLAWLALCLAAGANAQPADLLSSPAQMKRLSLEELLNVEVTVVSRHAERASHAAAAVEAIPQEQIERTGAASVPDALRLAAGVQVSRFAGHSYAISSRGFASLAANKLEVMQDGRSLYSRLFSGVFWDAYGTLLDDLDRIEVIRGPGATMWGANAVNGVINIISKDASATQGTLLKAGGGTEERAFTAVRYGGKLGDNTYFRVYGQYWHRDSMALANGGSANDSSHEGISGFRLDSTISDQDRLTLQGDYLENDFALASGANAGNRSANLLGRWTHHAAPDSDVTLQLYYDRFERNVPGQFGEARNTYDADAQYTFQLGERHSVVAGMNYRASADQTRRGGTIEFTPRSRTIHIMSAFVQDEIALIPDTLALVIGSKFQYESLDGFEPQPTVRLAWNPTEQQTIWASFSRAVRMPARIDEDLRFTPVPTNGLVFVRGNPDFKPEEVFAYELGWRFRPHRAVFVDVAGYYNRYNDLRSLEPTPPFGIPLVQQNLLDAETYGVELSVKYQPAAFWRLSANYTCLHKNLLPRASSQDPNRGALEGNDAPHLFSLWSSWDLPRNVTLDAVCRYVDALPNPEVPACITLDLRLGWRPVENLELALVGQNLLENRHREFGAASPSAAEVERGFYGKLTLTF